MQTARANKHAKPDKEAALYDEGDLATLLEGKSFSANQLGTPELNIISDTQLETFANGELDNLNVQMVSDINLNVVLRKDEKIVFYLAPIDLLEERSQQVRTGGGSYSFRIAKGW